MVRVIRRQRKSPVLTVSSIPCLRQLPTLNITQGCSLGCAYCYIKGYHGYPGDREIVLYDNTPELIRNELQRKRTKPNRVYFSPSSDAFQFQPEVQDVTYETMRILLEAGIEVSFLTKGFVKDRFVELFARWPARVFAQIGVTSLDRDVWHCLEPRTAPPDQRIASARRLIDIGVDTSARLDPLIPELTDAKDSLTQLLAALRKAGIRRAAASYLFLRPPFGKTLIAQIETLGAAGTKPQTWHYQRFSDGCGGGKALTTEERSVRFDRLFKIGSHCGVEILACRCKNPDLATKGCLISGPPADAGQHDPPTLFDASPAT